MELEHIEQRDGVYYVWGTKLTLDSMYLWFRRRLFRGASAGPPVPLQHAGRVGANRQVPHLYAPHYAPQAWGPMHPSSASPTFYLRFRDNSHLNSAINLLGG